MTCKRRRWSEETRDTRLLLTLSEFWCFHFFSILPLIFSLHQFSFSFLFRLLTFFPCDLCLGRTPLRRNIITWPKKMKIYSCAEAPSLIHWGRPSTLCVWYWTFYFQDGAQWSLLLSVLMPWGTLNSLSFAVGRLQMECFSFTYLRSSLDGSGQSSLVLLCTRKDETSINW